MFISSQNFRAPQQQYQQQGVNFNDLMTTQALGEEGGGGDLATTMALGEEGGGGIGSSRFQASTSSLLDVFNKADGRTKDAFGNQKADGVLTQDEISAYLEKMNSTKASLQEMAGILPFLGLSGALEQIDAQVKSVTFLQTNYDAIAAADGKDGISTKDIKGVAGLDGDAAGISKLDIAKAKRKAGNSKGSSVTDAENVLKSIQEARGGSGSIAGQGVTQEELKAYVTEKKGFLGQLESGEIAIRVEEGAEDPVAKVKREIAAAQLMDDNFSVLTTHGDAVSISLTVDDMKSVAALDGNKDNLTLADIKIKKDNNANEVLLPPGHNNNNMFEMMMPLLKLMMQLMGSVFGGGNRRF